MGVPILGHGKRDGVEEIPGQAGGPPIAGYIVRKISQFFAIFAE